MTSAESVAAACRVLAATGLVEHVLGHVSVRTGPDRLLVRCRGPRESGLAWTTERDVREVPLAGAPDVAPWTVPNELPIHRVLLRRRPEVTAVVHAHPPAVVAYSLLDRPLLPVYGAYDIPGAALAAGGVPVWPRAALVRTDALAGELADALGDRPVVVLRGHGLVSVAAGPPETAVPQAVLQAARGRHARPQHARGAAGRRHAAGDRRRRPGRAARSRRRLHRRDDVAAPAAPA